MMATMALGNGSGERALVRAAAIVLMVMVGCGGSLGSSGDPQMCRASLAAFDFSMRNKNLAAARSDLRGVKQDCSADETRAAEARLQDAEHGAVAVGGEAPVRGSSAGRASDPEMCKASMASFDYAMKSGNHARAEADLSDIKVECSSAQADLAGNRLRAALDTRKANDERGRQAELSRALDDWRRVFEKAGPGCISALFGKDAVDAKVAAECAPRLRVACAEATKGVYPSTSRDPRGQAILQLARSPQVTGATSLWVAVQGCVAAAISRTREDANSIAVEHVAAEAKAGRYLVAAACLESCVLTDEGRRTIEALEGGRGYREAVEANVRALDLAAKDQSGWNEASAKSAAGILKMSRGYVEKRKSALGNDAQRLTTEMDRVESALRAAATASLSARLATIKKQAPSMENEDLGRIRQEFNDARAWLTSNPGGLLAVTESLRRDADDAGAAVDARASVLDAARDKAAREEDLRERFCANALRMRQLAEGERMQAKINRASGTVDLRKKRELATARVFLTEENAKIAKELRAAKLTLSEKRDCPTEDAP